MTFSVQSEVGQLRQAIVHRPGLELSRLTPRNIGELLFDDVLWASKAKEEHDVFAEILRDHGVRVHYFGQLLAETLELPEARAYVLDRVCTPEVLGPALAGPLRELFDDLDGPRLAEYLTGGVLRADLRPLRAKSLKWDMLRADDFLLPPLPNHLFTRDNSCWVYGGVSVNPMAKPARQWETLHMRAVYRYHPLFAALLARAVNADGLLLLTDVDAVTDGFGTQDARPIRHATPRQLRARSFPAGSMGPKVEAACRFAEATGRMAAIGRLDAAAALLRGEAGTIVFPLPSRGPERQLVPAVGLDELLSRAAPVGVGVDHGAAQVFDSGC